MSKARPIIGPFDSTAAGPDGDAASRRSESSAAKPAATATAAATPHVATLDPAHAIEIRSVFPSHLAVTLHGTQIQITLPPSTINLQPPTMCRIQLAGIARGHGTRFPTYTDAQRMRNAAMWASALTGHST
jgi:hypothetical protein